MKKSSIVSKILILMIALIMMSVTIITPVEAATLKPVTTVTKKTLYVGGQSYKIKFKNLASAAKVTYVSSNKAVAAVTSKGTIAPVAEGTAIITVTMNQNWKVYKCTIAVYVKINENTVIQWKDPEIEKYTRNQLGKQTGDITVKDVKAIQTIEMHNVMVNSLEDVKYFTNLIGIILYT